MRVGQQRGMSLVIAIFLVVIVASLAAFAVATTRATRDTTNLQLLSDRALAAARAGAEWAAFRALVQNVCPVPPAAYPQLNLTQGALRGFRLNITCVADRTTAPFTTVDITVTAQTGTFGSPDYAYRRITTRFPN